MATAYANPIATPLGAATATAGIGGAPLFTRSNRAKGFVNSVDFSFTIPASGAGSAAADIIVCALMDPFASIKDCCIFNDAMGAGVTFSVGKIDPNNSASTDAVHYADAVDVSVAGRFWITKNVPEQVGTDPSGAVTDTGNAVPGFGQLPIQLTMTIGGTPTAGQIIKGVLYYTDRT